MALVQYSDSESDADELSPPRPTKKLRQNPPSSLPPLPTAFHDLYASGTRVSVRDDPSLHGGRKRVIPHVEGNWPTHLYLEWYPSKEELAILDDIISQSAEHLGESKIKIHSLLRSDLGAQLPLHISLSRPVVLRTEQRQQFMETFQTAVQDSNILAFDTTTESLDCVSNYEETRWFFVLRVKKPNDDNLNHLLRLSNRSLALFGQPSLYETLLQGTTSGKSEGSKLQHNQKNEKVRFEDYSHCFHVSIAWSLTEPSTEDKKRIANVDLGKLRDLNIRFDCVKAKIGNNISSISLTTL